jgi:hypothetical protein
MAAKRHLGNRGEVPDTVSAKVSVNRRLGDKDRFRISDVGRASVLTVDIPPSGGIIVSGKAVEISRIV